MINIDKINPGDSVITIEKPNDYYGFAESNFTLGKTYVVSEVNLHRRIVKVEGLLYWYTANFFECIKVKRSNIINSILE